MIYYHRGWHRIADELESLRAARLPVHEHWFFKRDPRVTEIADTVSRTRVDPATAKMPGLSDYPELLQAAQHDPARLFDEEFETANEFLDFHLALLLHEGDALGIAAIKPALPDDAGIPERIFALGDAFERFRTAKANALVKLALPKTKGSPDCSFSIAIEPETNIACFRLSGSFEGCDVERLAEERDRVFRQLTAAPNRHLALVDIRLMSVQPLGGFTAFGEMLLRHEPRALRIAFLVVSNFVGKQAQAAARGRGAQFFLDEAEARDWLLQHDAPPIRLTTRKSSR